MAVNLNHFVQVADQHRQQVPPLIELKRHLKTSRCPKHLAQKAVNSAVWSAELSAPKTAKCWVFEKGR